MAKGGRMKRTIFMVAIAFVLAMSNVAIAGTSPAPATSAPSAGKCMDNAQSQAAMNACASQSLSAADKELNQVYQQVLHKYAKDTVFIGKLKAAQKAWLAFRDAELAARFPVEDKTNYGSVYPMCASNELEAMTLKRTEELREWLKGTQEGDVCAGSYQTNS